MSAGCQDQAAIGRASGFGVQRRQGCGTGAAHKASREEATWFVSVVNRHDGAEIKGPYAARKGGGSLSGHSVALVTIARLHLLHLHRIR